MTSPASSPPPGEARVLSQSLFELADLLQREGLTLSEIADTLNTGRQNVVKALYWDRVIDYSEPVEIEPVRRAYAGAQ
ncbi:MAG: hypothetical protein JWM16_6324 [Verrucomicrobiales bacterium]|nr:hypothetical protein [Verrucomicrobiales bacterium]